MPVLLLVVGAAILCPRPPALALSTEKKLGAVLKRLYTIKKYDQAVELVRKYVEKHRGRLPEGRLSLLFGKVLMKSSRTEDRFLGSQAFRWAYLTDPDLLEEGLFHYAESLRKRGFLEEALYSYKRFFERFPRSVFAGEARLKCAGLMVRVGRPEDAEELLQGLLERPAFRGRALLGLMEARASAGDFAGAAEFLAEAGREDPDLINEDPDALVWAARVGLGTGDMESARFYAEVIESKYPGTVQMARAYLVLAEVMLEENRTAEAEYYYVQARQEPETAPWAVLGLQKIMLSRGNFGEARQRGLDLLEQYPYFVRRREVRLLTGRACVGQGRLVEALDHFEKAGAVDELVDTLIVLEKSDAEAFLDACSRYWDTVSTEMRIGELLLAHGRPEAALKIFKANLTGPRQERAIRNLAHAYQEMGLDGLARDFLADLIRRGTRDDEVFRLYAGLSARRGDPAAALRAYRRIRKKTGADWMAMGALQAAGGRSAEAIRAYGKAVEAGLAEALMERAALYLKLGKRRAALRDYRRAAESVEDPTDRLWAAYQAGLLSGSRTWMKQAAEGGGGAVSKVALVLLEERSFRDRYGTNRALK